jgi:hypothetical protein
MLFKVWILSKKSIFHVRYHVYQRLVRAACGMVENSVNAINDAMMYSSSINRSMQFIVLGEINSRLAC